MNLKVFSRGKTNSVVKFVFAPKCVMALLILFHICIAIFLAKNLNVWIDEVYSLYTTGEGVRYAIKQSISFELQPPLYFVLLSLWRSGYPGSGTNLFGPE